MNFVFVAYPPRSCFQALASPAIQMRDYDCPPFRQELTIKSVSDTKKFPLLESFHWEILRLYPAPPFFFKSAKMDLVVPTSSGQRYQVSKHRECRPCCS